MDSPTSPVDPSTTRRPGRRTALGLVLLVLGTMLAFTGAGPLGASAGALTRNGIDSVTVEDSVAYPGNLAAGEQVPAGCQSYYTSSSSVLVGLTFSRTRGGDTISTDNGDMAALGNLLPGDVVTMDWTDWREGCDTAVSLAVKAASAPFFESTSDQALIDFNACTGPDDATCTVEGGYQLVVAMPGDICNYQFDAVVGPPLDVVGPAGSFYSNGLRQQADPPKANGPDMLISANNGGSETCAVPTATVVCDAQGALVTVSNPHLLNTVRVDITADGTLVVDQAPVGPGTTGQPNTEQFTVPFGPGEDPTIVVTAAGETLFDGTVGPCNEPSASAVLDCQAGSILITTNPGGVQPVTFTVTADGAPVALAPDGTATVPAGDAAIRIVISAPGFTTIDQLVGPCDAPEVDVDVDCQEGEIVVTVTQPTDHTVTFVVTADGEEVAVVDGVATIPTGDDAIDVVVTADGETLYDDTIASCEDPSAEATLDCETGQITVEVVQPQDHTVEFVVTADGEEIPVVDGVATIPAGDAPVDIVVTADGEELLDEAVGPCDEAVAATQLSCESGTITVTVTQPDDHTVDFVVTADGVVVPVVGGVATVPSGDGVPVAIVVTADGETVLQASVPPCNVPTGDATVECSTSTITVTTTQPNDHTVDFGATANGTPLTLTNGTATTTIGTSPVTVVVTADGVEIHRETIQPCTEVQGVQQTRTPTQQLPRTGADESGRLALAIGMVILGFGLVLAGEDRRLGLLINRK